MKTKVVAPNLTRKLRGDYPKWFPSGNMFISIWDDTINLTTINDFSTQILYKPDDLSAQFDIEDCIISKDGKRIIFIESFKNH